MATHNSNCESCDSFHFTHETESFTLTNTTSSATDHCSKISPRLLSSTESCFCTFLHIPRHLLFLQHLPHCSRGMPIQEWSILKTENSRTDPNAFNIKRKAAALAVTTFSSFLLLNSTRCRHEAPTCLRSQRPPELRHDLPEGLAYLRHHIPVGAPQGTPRRQRTGGTAALGSGFRYVHPRDALTLPRIDAPHTPGPLRGITADKQTPRRAHPEGRGGQAGAGGCGPAAAPSRAAGARSASPGRRSHFEPLRISGSGRGAPGTAMAAPRPPWRVTSYAPGPAVKLEGVVHHAGHQAHGAGGLGGGGTHGEQQQQRRSRQTYLGACVRASAPGLLLLLPLLQPGM